jgi:hypothetical protein
MGTRERRESSFEPSNAGREELEIVFQEKGYAVADDRPMLRTYRSTPCRTGNFGLLVSSTHSPTLAIEPCRAHLTYV